MSRALAVDIGRTVAVLLVLAGGFGLVAAAGLGEAAWSTMVLLGLVSVWGAVQLSLPHARNSRSALGSRAAPAAARRLAGRLCARVWRRTLSRGSGVRRPQARPGPPPGRPQGTPPPPSSGGVPIMLLRGHGRDGVAAQGSIPHRPTRRNP